MTSEQDLRSLVDRPYLILLEPDAYGDGRSWYMARHPELPGCQSDGPTPDEAVANLADARELYIRSLIEDGRPVPEAAPAGAAPCCDEAARAHMLALDNRRLRERIAALENAAVAGGEVP